MGLFSRHRAARVADAAPEPAPPDPDPQGPWDAATVPEAVSTASYIDLGSLRVPAVAGMQLRLESMTPDGHPTAAVIVLAGSSLELRAFAAPRTTGIWEELREDITLELRRGRARTSVTDGPHGPEITSQVPVRDSQGHEAVVNVRFIGVDGPRWFLRGVLQGRAASDEAAAAPLREVLDQVVVVRDSQARPPREILPLRDPSAAAGPEPEDLPGLDPLRPGPTIAEVR